MNSPSLSALMSPKTASTSPCGRLRNRGNRGVCRTTIAAPRVWWPAYSAVLSDLDRTGGDRPGLECAVIAALAAVRLPVVVVNPRQVRDFAKATGKLAKTDALDAAILAQFAEVVRPVLRPLPDAAT